MLSQKKASLYSRRKFFKKQSPQKNKAFKKEVSFWPIDFLYEKKFISFDLFAGSKRYIQATSYVEHFYPSLAVIKNPLMPRGRFNSHHETESEEKRALYIGWKKATSFLRKRQTKEMVDKVLIEGDMTSLNLILQSPKHRFLLKESFEALGRIFCEGGGF